MYARAIYAKGEGTTTVLMPAGTDATSSAMQKKAYRSNQPSDTHYVERFRDPQKSLLNFQSAPFNIISQRDEGAKVSQTRPMTTIYTGKCRSQHPLSNFAHVTRLTAPNHN